MSLEYENIQAYRVSQKLLGKPIERRDEMAERLRCGGCGAPAGYFCLMRESDGVYPSRFTCRGIIGSQDPRTLSAFARAAEELTAKLTGKGYLQLEVVRVTARLEGKKLPEEDRFAEHHSCHGCGAPAGYRCLNFEDVRLKCRHIKAGEKTAIIQGLMAAEWQRTQRLKGFEP